MNEANGEAVFALQAALRHEAAGDTQSAARQYQRVVELVPDHPGAHLRLGQFARARGDADAARRHLVTAVHGVMRLGLREDGVSVYTELVTFEREQGNSAHALRVARHGQAQCGEVPALLWAECEALQQLGDESTRLHRLNRLARLQSDNVTVLAELGLALLKTSSSAQAVKPLRRAIELGLENVEISLSLASVELINGDTETAIARLHTLLDDAPDHLGVLSALWQALRTHCQWRRADEVQLQMLRRVESGARTSDMMPFALFVSDLSAEAVLRYNRYVNETAPAVTLPPRAVVRADSKIRIGYLSSDLHDHATSILIAGLFECHDHTRFEVFAYSYGPRVDDHYRRRLRAAIPHWRELNDVSDPEAARTIQDDQIDILIEMKGLTAGARMGIPALRPAPVMVHYLGFPGTLRAAGIDYLVADETLIPVSDEPFYAEKILRMPRCYQVNDNRRAHPDATTRSALGLPDDAIVLCNFNQPIKWTSTFFDLWLRALAVQPSACLWLLDPGPLARAELLGRAHVHGYGVAQRIIWAPKVAPLAHLARLAAADLALDQLPCTSHTTGADALWMGVPMLTCLGSAFHGRVGASLLNAVDLPEFIAQGVSEYGKQLIDLVTSPQQLATAKMHLNGQRSHLALFDTQQFTRDWETLLSNTYAQTCARDATK